MCPWRLQPRASSFDPYSVSFPRRSCGTATRCRSVRWTGLTPQRWVGPGSARRSVDRGHDVALGGLLELEFLGGALCLMVLLGFLMVACRGDLSAMALPAQQGG